jgi:nucleotide-binding universal stress UspA family protein
MRSEMDSLIWHGVCLIRNWSVFMKAMKRILVPIDFGEASDAALVYGRNLAKAFGAELHVLHVMENQFLRPTFKSTAAVETGIAKRVAKRLTPEDRATLHAVTAVRRSDEPSDEIVQYADQEDIDLIVMGTHGRVRVAHLLMGSVAEQVVRTARCPVMTVHNPEREFVMPDNVRQDRPSGP